MDLLGQCFSARRVLLGCRKSGAQYYSRDDLDATGGRGLHLSAVYPAEFGNAVFDVWMQAVSSVHQGDP
eukprot:8018806-Lingulodinium_polyedra.AAC.1